MRPTEELKNEHNGVLLALKILEKVCNLYKEGNPLPVQHIAQLLDFLTVFVDKCHHGKEEELLFPAMIELGFSKTEGPIAVMLFEHQEGRSFIKGMKDAYEQLGKNSQKGSDDFIQHAMSYIGLLRQHIEKENNVLFMMADSRISQIKQKELLEGFEEIEEKQIGKGRHEEFHEMLHLFRDIYLK